MATATEAITVRDAADRLSVTPRTLKYYEELGIVVPARSEGRYRLYEPADLEKLERVLRLRSLGFSLTSITAMLQQRFEVPPGGGRPRLSLASLKALREDLAGQLQLLDARVEQVRRELKEAAALQAHLRRDIEYVDRRLGGAPPESALNESRRAPASALEPARKAVKK